MGIKWWKELWPLSFFWVLLYERVTFLQKKKKKKHRAVKMWVFEQVFRCVCLDMKPAVRD